MTQDEAAKVLRAMMCTSEYHQERVLPELFALLPGVDWLAAYDSIPASMGCLYEDQHWEGCSCETEGHTPALERTVVTKALEVDDG